MLVSIPELHSIFVEISRIALQREESQDFGNLQEAFPARTARQLSHLAVARLD